MNVERFFRCGCGGTIRVTNIHPNDPGHGHTRIEIPFTVRHEPATSDERCRLYVDQVGEDEKRATAAALRNAVEQMQRETRRDP
jgi:hypothetical protein